MRSMNGNKRRVRRSSTSATPSRSWMLAGWTATLSNRPSVSTRIWRLRPVIFLRALGALAVDDRRGRACLPSRLLAYRHIERVMDALQRAIPGPQVEIGPHCALRRQVFGQRLPLAACPQHVENSVQSLAHVDRALAAALLSRWHHGLDNRPFGASQITRITKTDAVRSNAMFRLPHRALPLANQTPNIESQPIHQTQQLPGSALTHLKRVLVPVRIATGATRSRERNVQMARDGRANLPIGWLECVCAKSEQFHRDVWRSAEHYGPSRDPI